jgi:hypothetical protein
MRAYAIKLARSTGASVDPFASAAAALAWWVSGGDWLIAFAAGVITRAVIDSAWFKRYTARRGGWAPQGGWKQYGRAVWPVLVGGAVYFALWAIGSALA